MSNADFVPTILTATTAKYPLHLLGWKAFQDLCVAVAEECLRRPVQSFLPNNDAGRDGAFVGKWEGDDPAAGESTIQCKFTSQPDTKLSLSMLDEELDKARSLAAKNLACDYIILTNHPVTGASELGIKEAFTAVGVGHCRVFGADWINQQIRSSPRLRMMAPRLYGLGDLSELLDTRAYAQAKLILSAMGDDIQRLVITEAHRKSVRAISAHNLVLLLGAPAAGKSTIGASLAVGAADIWGCETIRATSPEDIQKHLNPGHPQFFWIDDAWGNTQYQRQTIERWNQLFPLMQGAIKAGTKFLITSRDYIWKSARRDLKLQALPLLSKSQVIINVHELTTQEKAQILYNHLKLGDQPIEFRASVKDALPELAERKDFLPETARRLGSVFFAGRLPPLRTSLLNFFERPADFLLETITSLDAECRAAIGLIFMNGGKIRSPVELVDLEAAAVAFGVQAGAVREQLEALDGSLLILAHDEMGAYWSYKHPTVGDAFAKYVAGSPELIEIYLKGAKPESLLYEVVCAGCHVYGAPVIVPDSLHDLLASRIQQADRYMLVSFLSYRSNRAFSAKLLGLRPDILEGISYFSTPVKDDSDARLVAALHAQNLLPEELRLRFVDALRQAAVEEADSSFLDPDEELHTVLSSTEFDEILSQIEDGVLAKIEHHIQRLRNNWEGDMPPEDYFEPFTRSVELFADAISKRADYSNALHSARSQVNYAVAHMSDDYHPPSSTSAPTSSSSPAVTGLANLFRDVDQ